MSKFIYSTELNEAHEHEAYTLWWRRFAIKVHLHDIEIAPYLNHSIAPWKPNEKSWLAFAREALNLSSTHIANRLGAARSAIAHAEKREKNGSLTLNQLYQFCEALDCELIVAVRPKNKKLFKEVLWEKLLPEAKKKILYSRTEISLLKKINFLANTVQAKAYELDVMKKLGLSRKKSTLAPPLVPPSRRHG